VSGRRLSVLLAAHISSLLARSPGRVGVARDVTLTLSPVMDALAAEMRDMRVTVKDVDTLVEMIANGWVDKYRDNGHKYPSQGAVLTMIREASLKLLNKSMPVDLRSREQDPYKALQETRSELRKVSLQLGELAGHITELAATCSKVKRKVDQIEQEAI